MHEAFSGEEAKIKQNTFWKKELREIGNIDLHAFFVLKNIHSHDEL